MPEYPSRKWPRLKTHDYSAEGFYFITICTKGRKCMLSDIVLDAANEPVLTLSEYGQAADSFIQSTPGIDKYVIMPNHIHMIIHKTNGKSIANDVRSFKALTTKKTGVGIWQDSYYDHVIRDEQDYLIKWNYIDSNPAKWLDDEYHP